MMKRKALDIRLTMTLAIMLLVAFGFPPDAFSDGALSSENFSPDSSPVREAPTDIQLSNNTMLEKQPIGTQVGVLTTTDPDLEDTDFTYSLVDDGNYPDNLSFSISGDQLLTAAVFDYQVQDTYTILVRSEDLGGEFLDKSFTIFVQVPVANPDSYQWMVNTTLIVSAPGVLDNDYAPAGYTKTADLLTNPAQGTLTLNPNGSFVYNPPLDWTGTTFFTYRACVGESCSTPTQVNLEIRKVPVAVSDTYGTLMNAPLTISQPGVLGNDLLGQDATITADLVTSIPTGQGSLVFSMNGGFTYTPPVGYTGTTGFSYRACDSEFCSDPIGVTIHILKTACLQVTPKSLNVTLPPDANSVAVLSLTNVCQVPLDYSFVETSGMVTSPVMVEGFEANGTWSAGWSTEVLNTSNTWEVVPNPVDEGQYAAWVSWDADKKSDEWLISPVINVSAFSDLVLSFRAYSNTFFPDATVKVWVLDANKNPLTGQPLWDMIKDEDWQGNPVYRTVIVNLSQFGGLSGIRVAWQYVGENGQSIGLDTIRVGLPSNVPWLTPSPLSGTIPAGTSQNVTAAFNSMGMSLNKYPAMLFIKNTVELPNIAPYPAINVSIQFNVEVNLFYFMPLIFK